MDFEKAFSDFIDGKQYDEAQSALFFITREAFKAGWKAAADNKPIDDKIVDLKQFDKKKQ